MAGLALCLFGTVRIEQDGKPYNLKVRKGLALLAYLAVEGERRTRDHLAGLFWPDFDQARARANLRRTLSRLNQTPFSEWLLASNDYVALQPGQDDEIDIVSFNKSIDSNDPQDIQHAISQYTGDFLGDFYLEDSIEFEDWAAVQRESYRRRVLDALQDLTNSYIENLDFTAAKASAHRQLEIDNLAESAWRQLIETLAREGRRSEAIAQYKKCQQVLQEELGVEPSLETQSLYESILEGTADAPHNIHGFELQEKIGEDRFGFVYHAYQPAIKREVAIKVIQPMYANNPDFVRRFDAEAQKVAQLEHPCIVPLYDYWREPGRAMVVTRWMRGGSLRTKLEAGPLELEAAVKLVEQIASALAIAHRRGVVHGDLKPTNILFDEEGNAYLSDFGITKNLKEHGDSSESDLAQGSIYTSPEQLLNELLSPQSDIYNLGLIIYEMLAGEPPFKEHSSAGMALKHLQEPLPLLGDRLTGFAPEIDIVIQKATAKKPQDRFPDARSLTNALRQGIFGDGAPLPIESLPRLEIANPYKGLRAYTEADQELFFGRQNLIQRLIDHLTENRFLAVVGPSGSGKSSVVRAGLIPALRQGGIPRSENWFITEFFPGTYPLEEMEAALLRVAIDSTPTLLPQLLEDGRGLARVAKRILPENSELLLVIDQFEELFTLTDDEEMREQVINNLVSVANDSHSRVRVVITLRADFYDRPLRYHAFGELIQHNTQVVIPPTKEELDEAIQLPAKAVGVSVENSLIATIVPDIYDRPGAFPLMQYALTELFDRRQNNLMTLQDYESIGGVAGALGRRAEDIYLALDDFYQVVTQQIFLRLVTVNGEALTTRRRVPRSDLESIAQGRYSAPQETVDKIINAFGQYRLLSFDHTRTSREPTVEIAHESLLLEWYRLRDWIKENQDDLRQQQRISFLAREWLESGKTDGFLLRGSRLDQFSGWADNSKLALNADEQAYLEASVAARAERQEADKARQQRELETAHRLAETERIRAEEQAQTSSKLRQRAIYLAGALLVAALMAVAALVFGWQSNQNANLAEHQARLATSRELSSAALNNLEIDPERSILLALQALDTAYTLEAEEALHQAVQGARVITVFEGHTADVNVVTYSPDGSWLATSSSDGTARIWDRETGESLLTLEGHTAQVFDIAFHPSGEMVATGSEDGSVKIWNPITGQEQATLTLGAGPATEDVGEQGSWLEEVAFSPDGRYLAAGNFGGTIKIWDSKNHDEKQTFNLPQFTSLAFSPDGDRLATAHGFETATVTVWEIDSGSEVFTLDYDIPISQITYSPDGTRLAISSLDGSLVLWDAFNGKQLAREVIGSELNMVTFDPGGEKVAVAHPNGTAVLLDAVSLDELLVLRGHTGAIGSVAFSPDGARLASASADGTAREWDIGPSHELLTIADPGGPLRVAYSPDGNYLATTNYAGQVNLWDSKTGELIWQQHGHEAFVGGLDFSPDGTKLASSSDFPPVIILWDVTTGEQLNVLVGHTDWVNNVSFNPDGSLLGSASADFTARVWDLDGTAIVNLEHPLPVWGIDFHPRGEKFATSPWDASRGDPENISSPEEGDEIVPNEQVVLWDLASSEPLASLGPHSASVRDLAFNNEGNRMAVGDWEGGLKVWDTNTGEEIFSVEAFNHTIFRVAFSPDDSLIATVGLASKVWDAVTGQRLLTLQDHSDVIYDVTFSPDGRHLTTSSVDGTIRVHLLDLDDLKILAEDRLTRWWTDDECQQFLHNPECPQP